MRKSAALRLDAEKAQHFGFSQEELEALSWIVCRSLLPLNQSVMNGLWPCLLGTDLLNLYGKLQWAGATGRPEPLLAPLSSSSCGRGLVVHPTLSQPFPEGQPPLAV